MLVLDIRSGWDFSHVDGFPLENIDGSEKLCLSFDSVVLGNGLVPLVNNRSGLGCRGIVMAVAVWNTNFKPQVSCAVIIKKNYNVL